MPPLDLPAVPLTGRSAAEIVATELASFSGDPVAGSPAFRGGQEAADAVLAHLDITGYAATRNEVWPPQRRGASGLSPFIRHGLLTLPRVWEHVATAPRADREKFRDELMWQEYSRHLYARLGRSLRQPLRYGVDPASAWTHDPWDRRMACIDLPLQELADTGWLVNQTRMWLASQWTVRGGAGWRAGAAHFHRHLLDGSHAANLAGWQWTVGSATGRPYAFGRWQVERRAPGLCQGCALRRACPIASDPAPLPAPPVDPDPRLRRDPDPRLTAGPLTPVHRRRPERVLLTMESLGDDDPALCAHPDLPVVVALDPVLLTAWQLSSKRLIFWLETVLDLAARRPVSLHLGPARALVDAEVAVTFAPVPGFTPLAAGAAVLHPWPWLVRPGPGPLTSFTAWRRALGTPG